MRSHYVYIMCNRSGTLYTGFCNNLPRRTAEHRAGSSGFTKRYRHSTGNVGPASAAREGGIVAEWVMSQWKRGKSSGNYSAGTDHRLRTK